MGADYNSLLDLFKIWLSDVTKSVTNYTGRPWNMLGITQTLNKTNIDSNFDRKALNTEYVTKYNNKDTATKKAYAHLQMEINLIYGMHKSFALRHKSRLQYYGDDLSQKAVRTTLALSMAQGQAQAFKQRLTK